MKKIGIITFHAAHNYGSVLQAFATQYEVDKLADCQSEIINYRLKTQKEFYSLFHFKLGFKTFVRDIVLLPFHKDRKKRYDKFEKFIKENYRLTSEEYNNNDDINSIRDKFDICITGSDQTWNINVPEIMATDRDNFLPYLLAGFKAKKISYASCIGNMTKSDLIKYAKYFEDYKYLSTREKVSAGLLHEVTNLNVRDVLDPTLLLNKDEWTQFFDSTRRIDNDYLLFYSVYGHSKSKEWIKYIIPFAKKNNLKVVCITPFFPVLSKEVINIIDAGPFDFLNYFYNAKIILTDSFHGTAFSINFRKPFYTLGNKYWKEDIRKKDLLIKFNLENRIINDQSELLNKNCDNIIYDEKLINNEILMSKKFLISSILD